MKLHRLGGSSPEVSAALLLRDVAGVLVETDRGSPEAERLAGARFSQLPPTIEVVANLPFSLTGRPRSFRRNLASSLQRWEKERLRLSLAPAADFSKLELERLYFEVLVPNLYTRGWSPFGIHNHKAFLALLDADAWAALVIRDRRVVGGGILTARPREPSRVVGRVAPGSRLVGLVYGLIGSLSSARRAFLFHLAMAAGETGWASLSFGQDLAWMQAAYATVFAEKLYWGDALAFDDASRSLWCSLDACGEDMFLFRLLDGHLDLCAPEGLMPLAQRLSDGVARIIQRSMDE